jgi:hypothetical protein
MASTFYSSNNPGTQIGGITKTTTTSAGNNIELRVDTGVTGENKQQVMQFLESVKALITTDNQQ